MKTPQRKVLRISCNVVYDSMRRAMCTRDYAIWTIKAYWADSNLFYSKIISTYFSSRVRTLLTIHHKHQPPLLPQLHKRKNPKTHSLQDRKTKAKSSGSFFEPYENPRIEILRILCCVVYDST